MFRSMVADVTTRDVVEVCLVPMRGKKKVTLQCFVVDEISSISNVHPEIVREKYPRKKFGSQIFAGTRKDFKWTF